jgi:hypothetical protein
VRGGFISGEGAIDSEAHISDLREHAWQRLYEEAAMEFDGDKLAERTQLEEEAITARLRELGDLDGSSERQALQDAQSGLRVLRRERISQG